MSVLGRQCNEGNSGELVVMNWNVQGLSKGLKVQKSKEFILPLGVIKFAGEFTFDK
jgi:hypothetical protein